MRFIYRLGLLIIYGPLLLACAAIAWLFVTHGFSFSYWDDDYTWYTGSALLWAVVWRPIWGWLFSAY
jgi:hypothetical protein